MRFNGISDTVHLDGLQGWQGKKRRAPEKAFVSNDAYTIRLPSGERELVIEDTLMKIESKVVQLLDHKIRKQYALDPQDKATLCTFAAAMVSRVDPQANNFENFMQELHDMVKSMEEQHNSELRASLETAAMLDNLRPNYVAITLPTVAPLYYGMSMAIFVAPATDRFITSDSPTVWYNPEAYKWPPFWRSPGLAQQKIEVTMPLTPQYALYLSHNERIGGFQPLTSSLVQELNRRTRFHCGQWFVSWQGEVRDFWFIGAPPPEDRWENTPEGKGAIEQRQQDEKLKKLHEERLASQEPTKEVTE